MNSRLKRVRRVFIISIVGLVLVALASLTGTLLATNLARYDQQVSATDIASLTRTYPEVAAYIDTQKPAEPHFVTIATLVKQSQDRQVLRIILLAAIPITIASAVLGLLISQRLLKPVSESYAAQERLIQDAAHELRNPLAAMSATLEAAKLPSTQNTDDMVEALQRLERQTKQLIKINEDLLYLQKDTELSQVKNSNLSKITTTISDRYKTTAKEDGIGLSANITSDVKAKINPRDYEMVLRNLLDNAVKYTPKGGKITVVLRIEGSNKVLTIKDTGKGIPATDLPHVTEKFYRAENAKSDSGSGLGLALVQKVVDAYDAQIEIVSSEKVGTTVKLSIK